MQNLFKTFAADVALGCELLAIVLLGIGAIGVAWGFASQPSKWRDLGITKAIWLRFAARIIVALELTLAADIIRTAIAPTWNDIGQLAAIAAIRTILNLFLERDVEGLEARPAAGAKEG